MSKKDNIEQSIADDVQSLGFEIEYIEMLKEGQNNILRVVIDKKTHEPLTTDDCEMVSRKIEDKIDKLVKLEDGYILEVSSPGLERALKNIKLYRKYAGEDILIKLYKKNEDGKKEFTGRLEGVLDDETIEVSVDDKKISLNIAEIAAANTIYDFEKESI